jgi:Lrp/AsnC family leucine-responsive transcriptional regulator
VIDTKDRTILACLERDARLTYADIGEQVGLSASSVHDRVRKLEKAGVIRGYRAALDLEQIGMPITAVVSLALRPASLVESCYSVAGDNSYALLVRAPSTKDLEELLDALRAKLEVVTRATIVLSTPFEHRPILPGAPERKARKSPPQSTEDILRPRQA